MNNSSLLNFLAKKGSLQKIFFDQVVGIKLMKKVKFGFFIIYAETKGSRIKQNEPISKNLTTIKISIVKLSPIRCFIA